MKPPYYRYEQFVIEIQILLTGNIGNAFTVEPVFGTLQVAKELDSTKLSEYLITVKVTDKGEPALSTTVPAHVIVVIPDNSPPR